MVPPEPFGYSSTIVKSFTKAGKMNVSLGFRTLAVLAFVAVSTIVILKPEVVGGAASNAATLHAVVALSHG
jgi:hypothetical protein